jgi:hypothetical protein
VPPTLRATAAQPTPPTAPTGRALATVGASPPVCLPGAATAGQGEGMPMNTTARPSLAWTVRTPLTDQVRETLVEWLDAEFTDETAHRTGMRFVHDARAVVSPDVEDTAQFRVLIHWAPAAPDLPATDVEWATGQVQHVIRLLTGAPAGSPETLAP